MRQCHWGPHQCCRHESLRARGNDIDAWAWGRTELPTNDGRDRGCVCHVRHVPWSLVRLERAERRCCLLFAFSYDTVFLG